MLSGSTKPLLPSRCVVFLADGRWLGVFPLKVEKYAVVERSLQLEDPQPVVIWPAEVGPRSRHGRHWLTDPVGSDLTSSL